MKKLSVFYFCFFAFAFCLQAFSQTLTVREIMREPSMAGMRPEAQKLSPDGAKVIFSWNAENKEPRNLYITDSNGNNPRVLVNAEQNFEMRSESSESKLNYGLIVRDEFAKAREKNLGGVEFSPDSKRILFLQNSDIYVLDLEISNAKPRRITRTQGLEGGARWLDNDSILYSSGGNYFVLNIRETSLVQVTRESNPQAFVSVFNVNPTKDGKLIAYTVSDGSRQKVLFVPNYLGEFVQAPTTRRGFTDQKVFVTKSDGSLEKPFEIKLPKSEGVGYIRSLNWAADNNSLIVDRTDKDLKRRQLFFIQDAGGKGEKTVLVTEETDEKWIGGPSRTVETNPQDNSQILFTSERDGFNHLYLARLERAKTQPNPKNEIRAENSSGANFTDKVSTTQLTKGNYEINWAKWTADGSQFVFSSTEKNTAEREFYSYSIKDNRKTLVASNMSGMKISPQIDETNAQPVLLFEGSRWDFPSELFTTKICPD